MDSVESDNGSKSCIRETLPELLTFPSSPDIDDMLGEQEIFPRVGDQYQVELPPLREGSHQRKNIPTNLEDTWDTSELSLLGLPVPVMWVCDKVDNAKIERMEFQKNPDDADLPSPKLESCNSDKQIPEDFYPVPGSLGNSWSDIEQESFILGLYIFGKNLVQVKRFVESKEMGDIQAYYYGRFYKSDSHKRWSQCRKIRSRKSIHGQRIFTGPRQQELLSRLLAHVLEESKDGFVEVFKSFGEGKISLEEYVFNLKAMVGIKTLIDAIAIGKGKQDLTGIVNSVRTNQSIRQEIPTGKACNSLTSGDIVKFLTGDFRLSKARSNDLFWEAVWPRLLATGWHSEQPENRGYVSTKNSLVFLIPGIKKFSRRRHVKGNHYFDCVSDVLNKVALDPSLLEVEVEAPKENGNGEDYTWTREVKSEKDVSSDQQRHCYLRPRVSTSSFEPMKFTVVDTSLFYEGNVKMRELRTLPVEANNTSTLSSVSSETGESSDEPDSAGILNHRDESKTTKRRKMSISGRVSTEIPDNLVQVSKKGVITNGSVTTNFLREIQKDRRNDVSREKKVQRKGKGQLKRTEKQDQSNHVAPVKKRQRLTACSQKETNRGINNMYMDSRLKERSSPLVSPDAISENMITGVSLSQEVPISSSSEVNPDGNNVGIMSEKVERRTLIDLNELPDSESGDVFITEVEDCKDDGCTKGSFFPSETSQPEDSQTLRVPSNGGSSAEEQPNKNTRRQSTRNRPLTTKALEALACGYLSTNRKPREKKTMSRENSFTRTGRLARGKVNASIGSVDSKLNDKIEEECNSKISRLTQSQVQSAIKVAQELLGAPNDPDSTCHSENLSGNSNQPR